MWQVINAVNIEKMENLYTNRNEETENINGYTSHTHTWKGNTQLLNLQPNGSITDVKMVMIYKLAIKNEKKNRRQR